MIRGRAINSPKLKEQKRVVRWILIIAIPVCIALAIYTLREVLRIPQLQINDVRVTTTSRIPEEKIRTSISGTFSQSTRLGIPQSSLFFYSKRTVARNLKKDIPSIKNAWIEREGLHKIHVTVEEYSPRALWCEGEFLYHTFGETPCYYLTQDGYMYDRADTGDDNVFVRYYGVTTSTPSRGMQLFLPDKFHSLDTFVDGIIHYDLPVLGVFVDPLGNHQLYFLTSKKASLASSTFATLYFNERVPLVQTFENLKTFLQGTSFNAARATSTIEYIDARYGNTIFFKTKKP